MANQAGREAEDHLLSTPEAELPELAARLQSLAVARDITIATAESCTGGLVGHSITANSGSSAFYRGGIVSYADDVKIELLGVPPEAIERHGAVSAQVAVAMAEGVRSRVGADLGVAVTGVAGPEGGSDAKPVGLTYVATAGPDGHEVRRHVWDGDRAYNKTRSAAAALELVTAVLAGSDLGEPE
jgi:PncC family amidohydrolase